MDIEKRIIIPEMEKESTYEDFQSMKNEMSQIFDYLKIKSNDFMVDVFDEKMKEYIKKYHRILYSEISTTIFNIYQDNDVHSCLMANLDKVLNNVLKSEDEDYKKIIIKLWDHINLANNQCKNLKMNDKEIQENLSPLKEAIVEAKKEATKVEENIRKEIFSQLISIVSIFVAISFVMFGGMSLINGLFDFSNMKDIPLIELICLGSLIGIVMVSVMYAFIIFSLRLSFREFSGKSPFRRTYFISISVLITFFLLTFSTWLIKYGYLPTYLLFVIIVIEILFLAYVFQNGIKDVIKEKFLEKK